MTAQETSLLVGALIALITALQGWLVYKAADHTTKLDGLMGPRITAGAQTAIAADHVARAELGTPAVIVTTPPPATLPDRAKAARIAALQVELATLTKP